MLAKRGEKLENGKKFEWSGVSVGGGGVGNVSEANCECVCATKIDLMSSFMTAFADNEIYIDRQTLKMREREYRRRKGIRKKSERHTD